MPEFRHNPETGQNFIFLDGRWRPASNLEVNVERSGATGKAVAALQGATGLPGLISSELGQAVETVSPLTTGAGLAGSVLGAGALSPLRALVSKLPGRLGTVTERVTAQKGLRTGQGFRRNPDELLPDFAQGAGRIVRAGAETLPVTRMITDFLIRNPNQRNLNRLAGRAIGATDEEIAKAGGKLTPEVLSAADDRVGQMFDEVGSRIGAKVDRDDVLKLALDANQQGYITNSKMVALADETANQGRNLMGLRSEMQKVWRSQQDIQLRNKVENIIDEIDKIILEATDESTEGLYREARARYRASLAVDKGAALSGTGDVNAKSIRNALKSVYGRTFTRGKGPKGAPADVKNLLEGAIEAQGVNVGVPTSGTAERIFAGSLLGGTIGTSL